MLTVLSDRFKKVTALDHSTSMLDKARANLDSRYPRRVRFVEAEVSTYQDSPVDLIVLNMVLHHLSSPSVFFQDAARNPNDQGQLLIADLSPHKQDWARESCGDQWLGFDPADLSRWSIDAGFIATKQSFLGLNNGFQIQLRLFKHPSTTS